MEICGTRVVLFHLNYTAVDIIERMMNEGAFGAIAAAA